MFITKTLQNCDVLLKYLDRHPLVNIVDPRQTGKEQFDHASQSALLRPITSLLNGLVQNLR